MPDPTPTDWCWDPMPPVTGWFAVIRGWEPEEGMFPAAAWVEAGEIRLPPGRWVSGMALNGSSGHAGPFASEADARAWARAHDLEEPSRRGAND
jgi:hypothetical protein